MAWHYVLQGTSHGPVEEAELQDLYWQNIVTPETPVWTDGMSDWVPFKRSALSPAGTAMGPAIATHACAECGKVFPGEEMLQYDQAWVCAVCKPVFFQRIREGVAPQAVLVYAGIWSRFWAIFIDGILILIVLMMPEFFVIGWQGLLRPGGMTWGAQALLYLLNYGLPALYETFFVGKFGATPGKMLMKIKVVSPEGGPISYLRALGRHFAKILSGIILYIGYLMAIWDEEKRSLHDRICKTRVIIDPS